MRIVSGRFRGRVLRAPANRGTRPTSDKARETLFNVLLHAEWAPPLEGARVLDMFAGSGGLGFEALSRGADEVLFVDMAQGARAAIQQNREALRVEDETAIQRRDAKRLGTCPEAYEGGFDIILIDPPYHRGLVEPCLAGLKRGGWLAEGAFCAIETALDEAPRLEGWTLLDTREAGAAKFWFVELP